MSIDIPSVAELHQAAESGQRITPEDVSVISHAESEYTGRGPVRGGPAATAQSIAMRQMNFEAKLDEVARKPQSQITLDDAQDIQSSESRAFERRPRIGSVSDQVWSIANRNEALGMTPTAADMMPIGTEVPPVGAEIPAYVTKDDARQAQRAESLVYGGQVPSYGIAASMQSAADKLDNLRRNSLA
ncbi:hypothetical protein N7492_001547 [Penicillium capsulatum]|uniref:SMP domain-containing protein n=1 Tax=Penicillium capsulatum TaxID=69766 RepID=A0A9W9IXY9_9EURO|nr:hypothetical protein N7492_001547 [Penicillium capsulatum]KAJ6129400.1 hypothetical protein N7512_002180 [Penicillium capsulatum]